MDPTAPVPEPEAGHEPQPLPAHVEEVIDPETEKLEARIQALQAAGRRGANWLYWVAALSLVNSALIHAGANIVFIVGMGVCAIADTLAVLIAKDHPQHAVLLRGIAIGFAVLASGIAFLFGWLANRRYLIPFALAIVLYGLDGLLLLWAQDLLGILFHGYAIVCMAAGFKAYWELNKIERQLRWRPIQPEDQLAEK